MTFSVVVRGPDGLSYGVAMASKFLAVGNAVPATDAGVGAVATQSYANVAYRPQGLALLKYGASVAGTVAGLIAADPGRETRQLGVVGPAGDGASYSGAGCNAWAGARTSDGYACQGNILTGPAVVDEMERAWLATDTAAPLTKRGRQSAALYVVSPGGGYGGGSDVLVDLRVDDHPAPVPELRRMLSLHEIYFGKPDPAEALPLQGALAEEVRSHLDRLGYPDLETWMGVENYEERHVPGATDPLVLRQLRAAGSR